MTQAYTQLTETMQAVRQNWRLRRLTEGLLLVAAAAVGLFVLAAMLDHALALPPFARWLVAVLVWAAMGTVAWRSVGRVLLRSHSDDYLAALLEQRMPELGNRLINALQLGRAPGAGAPRLIEAIVRDGVDATESLEPGKAMRSVALQRHALALSVVLLLAVLYSAWGGPAAQASFARVLLPGANIAPFTWTRVSIAVEPGARVLEGSALTVRISTTGWHPAAAHLHLSAPGSPQRTVAAEALGEGAFRYAFASVGGPMALYATAGDGRSETVAVQVIARPRVRDMAVTYTYPAYTALDPHTPESFAGHLQGLPQTQAALRFETNKPLESLTLIVDDIAHPAQPTDEQRQQWRVALTLTQAATYHLRLRDMEGYELDAPETYVIHVERDRPPMVAITAPQRDAQVRPDEQVVMRVVAQDDHGLANVQLHGRVNEADEVRKLHAWPADTEPQRRADLVLDRAVEALGLVAGDRLEYWAVAWDRNDITGPGSAESRHMHLTVLNAEQAQAMLDKQLGDYAQVLGELIRLQRLNRSGAAAYEAAGGLIDRQSLIRRQTRQLAEVMARSGFQAATIIDQLHALAADPMANVVALLEDYRDAPDLERGRPFAQASLAVQDEIITALEAILLRLNRAEQVRERLRRAHEQEPEQHREVAEAMEKLATDLDAFLQELRELEAVYDKLPKRGGLDQVDGQSLEELQDIEHRLDRWKQWKEGSVSAITKLPQGFVPDSYLADNLNTIFEEIEKQRRPGTIEIATPVEEGAKALAEQIAEDVEMWMPHTGDYKRWVMEEPTEGMFQVPEAELPSQLQDMISDLIEDVEDFDEEADDITGGWGGNLEAGWAIEDGPISSFGATGKTGNQLPNTSEMSGRSGAGRRGQSSGQMVGAESPGYEGRPTPARVTNEPYEEGVIPDVTRQLDPRGATGGGKKTGGGQQGLQGGTPPDFVDDMQRLARDQALLRERAQQVAQQLDGQGRPLGQVQRAIELLDSSEQAYRDLRYQDGARQRKEALDALRQVGGQIDQSVNLSLQRARNLPPELREQISSGSQQAMPVGYEELVGAYYRALSEEADE